MIYQYLSEIELFYSSPENISNNEIRISEDEYKHCIKVMRHSVNDEIYVTNGRGEIFLSIIKDIKKDGLTASIKKEMKYENQLANVFFCIPKLKSSDRFEFALEKCTELGITNFIVFDSSRTIHKSNKLERWNKILLSAMKQSLLSYLPDLQIISSLKEIENMDGEKIVLEQNAAKHLNDLNLEKQKKNFFIFGPEGGFNNEELELFNKENRFKLADNRLRTETAIIKCAALISA